LIKKGQATIYVSDADAALRFYSEVLGMRVKSHWGKDFAELEMPGITIGLHPASKSGPKPGTNGSISVGLEVDDLDSEVTKLKEKRVVFQGSVLEDGPVRIAFFGDPDGNSFYLTQVKKGIWG
jgi:catechol 2,3-dioxygenase-like lactoylglutathione lyase family enzyme